MEAEESHTRGNCFHNGQSFERSHHRNWPFVSDCFNSNSRCFDLSLFNIRRDCCWWDIHRLNIQRLCRRRCFQKNSNSLDVVASDRRSSNWRGWIPCSACFGGGVRYDRFPSVRTACYRSGDRPVNSKGYDVVYISRLWNFGRSPCPAFDPRRISWSNRGSDYSDWTAALWVLVSMGAVLGGTMRSPFTGVIFSLELTHDVNALLPLLVGALSAEFVTVFTMKRSILTEKVARRGVHVAREYSVDVLELIPVRLVMNKEVFPISADAPADEIVQVIRKSGKASVGYPVVDAIGNIQGFLTRSEVLDYMARTEGGRGGDEQGPPLRVRDLVKKPLVVAFPDEPLRVAADRMAQLDSESLPVVDTSDNQRVVGLISREDLFNARVLWFAEEKQRERFLSIPKPPIKKVALRTRILPKAILGRRKANDPGWHSEKSNEGGKD